MMLSGEDYTSPQPIDLTTWLALINDLWAEVQHCTRNAWHQEGAQHILVSLLPTGSTPGSGAF